MRCDLCGNEATHHETIIRNGKVMGRHLCEQCARAQGVPGAIPSSLGDVLAQALGASVTPPVPTPPAEDAATPRADEGTPGAATSCPACGLTYAKFREDHVLGCPTCYRAFESQLGPLIERAQEGGTHHRGKVPRRSSPAPTVPPGAAQSGVPGTGAPARPAPGAEPAQASGAGGTPIVSPHGRRGVGVTRSSSSQADPAERARLVTTLRKQLNEAIATEQYERAAQLRDQLRQIENAPGGGTTAGPGDGGAGSGGAGPGGPRT